MVTASLVHIEIVTYYAQNGEIITPSAHQKLLWSIFGLPDDIKQETKTFTTEIDSITGFTKRDVEACFKKQFVEGAYSFLPTLGLNESLELQWGE